MPKPARTLVVAGLLLAIASTAAIGQVQTASCRTALLVIDMQKAWVGSRALTADGSHVTDKIAGILDSARSAGIPIVFVVDIAWLWRFGESQLAIVDPLEVLEGDLIAEKRHPNGFLETSLGDDLRGMGITTLLITGYASHECVSSTVDGALEQGFEIIIVEDGHSGGSGGYWAKLQNQAWQRRSLQVIPSAQIDFAALCAPTQREDEG
jgi:nicotinamidase-related amidase